MTSFWSKAAAEAARRNAGGEVTPGDLSAGTAARRSIRRDPPPLPADLTPTDDRLRLRLAEELDFARRLLDLMADELAGDSTVVARHPTTLQSFDIVGQMLGHIAAVVRSSDPDGAVERIGMAELKARLTRRGLT